ncbi:Transcriptional regulator [Vibrio chagasii]|uniref:winged helix-turn-helix transcriptional regulator n=1 Tax=Vibrio chagasii TaxID=170679 RepID=UPI001EFEDE25|nr:helix-turn-helix domain-containing protein [Vibrio chagasii]MCG9672335.1 helix-turn-helix transcriptional regulator [Vibrio chagasii]CAH6785296.1 Transcriptional regulator [Vibrio chagasii]CAH6811791.1 Transcriptional regulator [Vibrio chagasii]CAH6920296.1 Transcriptional regulator [Vibrio chagasii]CAH6938731.1 Transcriptional regulator [Vibrio chagasii]
MEKIPYPGKPVRGSVTGNPIMALFDLLGRRWAMGVLWQLCSGGACTFRELQNRCESISPAVLNSRIKELRQAKLIEKGELGYQPTELGQEIILSIYPLKSLAEQWVESLNDIEK